MSELLKICCGLLMAMSAVHAGERLYVNDKKVPETRKDLELIQSSLMEALPVARAATVCIKLKEGSGSGVVVSADGLVLTAAHVSGAVDQEVTLIFEDGSEVVGKTLGLDSERDAAMIRIVDPQRNDWPHVPIDQDDSCRLGDWVFALGHSGGFDKERGVVTRLGRLVKMANSTFNSDCILIGGDSGGPLFDLSGTLVGIHSRVGMALQENMHVPLSVFIDQWDELEDGEFIGDGPFAQQDEEKPAYLGIAAEAHAGGGIRIERVGGASSAAQAGLLVGDVLLKVNGQVVSKREDLQVILKGLFAGDSLEIEFRRGDEVKSLTLELGER